MEGANRMAVSSPRKTSARGEEDRFVGCGRPYVRRSGAESENAFVTIEPAALEPRAPNTSIQLLALNFVFFDVTWYEHKSICGV